MMDLYFSGKEDRVRVFISILFLARLGKIHVWQEKLPYGEIFLEVKVPWDIVQLEDVVIPTVKMEEAPVAK
jgi:segregation and condensation protein A